MIWDGSTTIKGLYFTFVFTHQPIADTIEFQFRVSQNGSWPGWGYAPIRKYGGRDPFDTGPLDIILTRGTGKAGCRIMR